MANYVNPICSKAQANRQVNDNLSDSLCIPRICVDVEHIVSTKEVKWTSVSLFVSILPA